MARTTGTFGKPTAEMIKFETSVVAKCRERGLESDAMIPEDLVDEVVNELYGGWTDEARRMVARVEARARRIGS